MIQLKRLGYRSRQFFAALQPGLSLRDAEVLNLTPAQYELWMAQEAIDRRHSMAVWSLLQQAGHTDPDLLHAALLHDAAKTVPLTWPGPSLDRVRRLQIWHRCMVVVLRAVAPGVLAYLSRPVMPSSWRYPFYLSRNHAELGAELAKRAGSSPHAIALIRMHTDHHPPDDTRPELAAHLRMLYWADDQN